MTGDVRNESDLLVAAAGFRLALCLEGKVRDRPDAARALLAWVRESHGDRFGKFSSTFLAPKRRDVAIKPKHFDIFDSLAKAPVVGYGFRFEGPVPDGRERFGLPYFGLWQEARSYTIDIALPEAPADLDGFVERLASILGDAPLIAGFAGYGFCPDPGMNIGLYKSIEPATRRFKAAASINVELFYIAMTHEGMANGRRAGYLTEDDKPGYLDMGWLTLLGPHLAARLPSADAIRATLPAEASVTEMPSGLLIRLGERPIWGDVNAGEDVSPFHALGSILEPIRYPDSFIGPLPFQGHEIGSRRYYWRFFPMGEELQRS